jgi:acyl-CoA thioesterase-2
VAIEKILDLEQLEVNIYRGSVFSVDSSAWQLTFGGHLAGQSLVSAVRTVHPRYLVHSLHGYFLRPGDTKAPTVFLVEPIRDGGSFCTRRVNAIQHGETIFSMSASFQIDQSGIEHQDAMPSAPPPDDLPGLNSIKVFDEAVFRQFDEWDVRIVPQEKLERLPAVAAQQQVWFRHRDPLPDDPVLHICALAYMSDLTLLGSAQVIHAEQRGHLQVTSLDHAMWFMRPFRADEWLLYDQSSPSACNGRSLTQGNIFNQAGQMVAAVMQEGLTRYKRDPAPQAGGTATAASRCAPATMQSAMRRSGAS